MHWTASCRRWRLSRGKKKGSQQVGLFFWLPFSEQFVRGYVKILGKDGNFIVRDETAALFDPQDGQVAALHVQELELSCQGSLGKPLDGA